MIINYYKHNDLKYATRKRFKVLPTNPIFFSTEEQKSVLLGDGAKTQVKTSVDNICDYVTIGSTRWFVTSYIYMNGGQITLFLQRDVIGEMGITDCFGKVERGYTNSILKNRKELNLNEILKKRDKLITNTLNYGSYVVDNHEKELWGIMYFAKPTELDPITGLAYPAVKTINIPAFNPPCVDYELLADNTTVNLQNGSSIYQDFKVTIKTISPDGYFLDRFRIRITYIYLNTSWTYTKVVEWVECTTAETFYIEASNSSNEYGVPTTDTCFSLASQLAEYIGNKNTTLENAGITFPEVPTIYEGNLDYTGNTIKDGSNYYLYSSSLDYSTEYGVTSYTDLYNSLYSRISFGYYLYPSSPVSLFTITDVSVGENFILGADSSIQLIEKTYTRILLTGDLIGDFDIDTTQELVSEPYSILVFPLFNVSITGKDTDGLTETEFIIEKNKAFMIFNTVIQYLSGENPYLIDAQVYPYCPILSSVSCKIKEYPFFRIVSSTYDYSCSVGLLPNSDVKKEYICRKYSLISPEQTGKFDFNFYDYVTNINQSYINVNIRTSLKPFNIVSTTIIIPSIDSLKGITYDSDLRGSQSSSNGFQCSLASNAFETYNRQNSNFQAIFNLDKTELAKQHDVERVNEKVSGIVNTVSATAMGAIAGGALGGGVGLTAAGGAAVGGGIAGGIVGGASLWQYSINEGLRIYEEDLQKSRFDLSIGTVKALPNSINRISSFNEIILKDFWYIIETYECSEYEKELVNTFIIRYGYGIGVFGLLTDFYNYGWFLRSTLISSNFAPNLHNIASKELMGGIYYYE